MSSFTDINYEETLHLSTEKNYILKSEVVRSPFFPRGSGERWGDACDLLEHSSTGTLVYGTSETSKGSLTDVRDGFRVLSSPSYDLPESSGP